MLQTIPYRNQHGRILTLLADLEASLDPDAVGADPVGLTMKSMHLVRWVQVHHVFEQESLFGLLTGRATPAERRAAERFESGLTRLDPVLVAHEGRWITTTAIAADPQGFAQATRALGRAIRERIDLEERHLYPLVESVMARDAAVREYLEA